MDVDTLRGSWDNYISCGGGSGIYNIHHVRVTLGTVVVLI